MKSSRYYELERDPTLKLTQEEIDNGWGFCNCEWDGMLVHKDSEDGKLCSCLQKAHNIFKEKR